MLLKNLFLTNFMKLFYFNVTRHTFLNSYRALPGLCKELSIGCFVSVMTVAAPPTPSTAACPV